MLVLDGVEMLDVRETATLAGRTPETVRRWVWSGRLAAQRHGNKLLVARRDVDSLLRGEAVRLSLSDWARTVEKARRAGALGETPTGATAVDLVLDDRTSRQAG